MKTTCIMPKEQVEIMMMCFNCGFCNFKCKKCKYNWRNHKWEVLNENRVIQR